MNPIKSIPVPIRIIISISLIAISCAYTFVNHTDPIFIAGISLFLAIINILLIIPAMVLVSVITLIQAVFIVSLVYVLQTAINPAYSVLLAIIAALLTIGGALATHKLAKGRTWLNLIVIFLTFDIFIAMSFFAQMANSSENQVLYIVLAFLTPIIFILIKNSLISRRIVKPILPKSNTTNTLLHQKVTKLLKNNDIKSYTKNGLITRYILAGERIIFLYEPASLGKSQITEKGLFFDGNDYSAFLEGFIKESISEANSIKINKNSIMPIVIVHDYKDNNVLSVKIFSSSKPDVNIGAAYICSPNGLIKLIKSLKAKARKKQAETAYNKYKQLFS